MVDTDPPPDLVAWAFLWPSLSGVNLPFDRPWYCHEGPIRRSPAGWQILCNCGRPVDLHRQHTKGGTVLYIGQCVGFPNLPGCQRIFWTYREK